MNNGILEFDEKSHTYRKDGIIRPSVTQILQELGLSDYSAVPKEILDRSANFGTAVHKTTELFDNKNLDFKSVDAPIVPYLDGWTKFCDDYKIDFIAVEKRFYCEKYGYCGTIDRIVYSKKTGQKILIDIKTTTSISPVVNLQTAGYAVGINEPNITRWAVKLYDRGYNIYPCRNTADTAFWLSALNVWKWKKMNNLIENGRKNA